MKQIRTAIRNLARCQSGTAAIEAIIAMPVAVSLMAGGVEFGRLISAYSTVDKSMRAAVRYLARVPDDAVCGWGLTSARNIAVYGQMTNSGNPLVPGWTTGTVALVSPGACGGTLPDPTIVQLRANVPFTVNMLNAVGLSNSFTLTVGHQERYIGE